MLLGSIKSTTNMGFFNQTKYRYSFITRNLVKKTDSAIVAEMLEYNINIIQVRKSRIFDLGGGVAILSKNELKLNLVKTETFFSFEHATCSISTNLSRLNITTMYYFGNSNKHTNSQFLSDFDDFLTSCAN